MRSGGKFLSCVFALALSAIAAARAAEPATATTTQHGEAAVIDAEKLSFDKPNSMAYGEGHVVLRYKGAVLQADRARFNTLTKDVWAEGHVRLNRDAGEWVGESLQYNLETHDLKSDKATGYLEPLTIRGLDIHTTSSNHYTVAHGSLTTCDYDVPQYRVEGKRCEVYPGDRVVMYNVTVRLGDVPVLWLPMMVWSLKGDQPPVVLSIGDSSQMGFFVLSSFYFPLNKSVGLTVHLDERTERGLGTGADLQYRIGEAGHGLLTGYFLSDANPSLSTNVYTGTDIDSQRYRVLWQHEQALTDVLDLNVTLNKQSDRAVVKDFFHSEFENRLEPEATASITQRGPNYTLSLLVRPQFDSMFAETQRLPELRLAVDRTRLGHTPLFIESETSVAQLRNDAGTSGVSNFFGNAWRADTFHQIVVPQLLGGWLSVVPRAGVRGTYYSRAPDASGQVEDETRGLVVLGAETSFKATRTWDDAKWPWLRVDGLRHIVQPFADYQWVPTPAVHTNELYQFDTVRDETLKNGSLLSVTRYSQLQFPAYNTIDDIEREDVLRFGLRQRLQTRRDGKPWDLIELEGWTDWRIERNTGERDFSDWFTMARVRPFEWIALNSFTRYDLRTGVLQEINNEFRVTDGERWSVGIGSRILRHDSNIGSLSVAYQLTRHWQAQMYQRADFQDGLWEEQQYGLRQETHDWFINYGFRYTNNRSEQHDSAVYFSVTLKAYPGFSVGANRVDVTSSGGGN